MNVALVPLSFFHSLREIKFSLVKDSAFQQDTTTWITEAARWLHTLSAQQNIERVAISWTLTYPARNVWRSTLGWRELQDLLDTIPALSRARMVLDATVNLRGVAGAKGSRMAAEQCAEGLRKVWTHPRCISNASRAVW